MRALLAVPALAVALAATVPEPTPGSDAPGSETPGSETPGSETPGSEAPSSAPGSGAPGSAAPGSQVPGSEAAVPPVAPLPAGAEVVADGLDNPRGLLIDADGAVWVTEAGGVPPDDASPCLPGPEGNEVCYGTSGAITRVDGDSQERVISGLRSIAERSGMNATGPHDLAMTTDGSIYVAFGLGADPSVRAENEAGGPEQLGRLFSVDPDSGELTEVADIAGFEASDNPDGGVVDSNPYSLAALDDGALAVTDAGGNSLLQVAADGTITPLAVFADRPVEGPDGSEVPMNAVPTGLAVGAEGQYYVGQLTGFPFPVGGANVYTVAAGGAEPSVFAEGFTNVIDVAVAPNGDLYVLEFNSGGMLSIDPADPSTLAGELIRVGTDGTTETVVSGLTAPTAVAVADDGTIFVTNVGVIAGAGQLLRIAGGETTGSTAVTGDTTAGSTGETTAATTGDTTAGTTGETTAGTTGETTAGTTGNTTAGSDAPPASTS